MKAIPLLLTFCIVGTALADEPPACQNFIGKFPSTNCGPVSQKWSKFTLSNSYFYLLDKPGGITSTKMFRAIQITDPTIKAKTLHAESIIAKLKHPNIPKLEDAIEFEGWRIQKYDKSLGDFFITFAGSVMEGAEVSMKEYIENLKMIKEIIEYVNSQGYVIANLNNNSFLWENYPPRKVYFYEFQDTVEKGTPIDDRFDFHYWEPSRLNGEEKVWTEKADHYAFGVTLFKAFHNNKVPFAGETKEEYTKNVNVGDYEFTFPCTPEIAFIIARMLHKDPKNRISLNDLDHLLNYLQTGKFRKVLSKPIKLNNQKPLPQELLDQIKPEFIDFVKTLKFSINPLNENEAQTNFWLSSKGIILISGLTLVLLALIVWAIMSCLQKNPDEQIADQKLSTGLDNTKDVEVPAKIADKTGY